MDIKNQDELFMVVDLAECELPLCVGTLEEISEYTGAKIKSIVASIKNANKTGRKCKYVKVE